MKPLKIPRLLHEMLGEHQSPAALAAILGLGLLTSGGLALAGWDLLDRLPGWRAALSLLLAFDIGAGCAANFTPATTAFYAARPRARWIFIAVHVHLPLLALLLGVDLGPAFGVWAYAVAAAAVVNLLRGRRLQPLAGGVLLATGMLGIAAWVRLPEALLALALMFMLKLVYAFAVDHFRGPDDGRPLRTGW